MRRVFFFLIGIVFITGLSGNIFAQWAIDKNARQDAVYARVLQSSETVVLDGIEDDIWSKADSVVVGYGQTKYLPGSGYEVFGVGQSIPGDSANAVFKCLYKAPYIYLLFKVVDKSVGGWNWGGTNSGFDGIIMSFKDNNQNHSWVDPWDKRMEHFYMWGYHWAYADSFPNPNDLYGAPPLYMGNGAVAGGKEEWRTPAQQERWTAVTRVNGTSMDLLPDVGWISEHRINVDSLGFNLDRMGDVLPFSFSMFDADNILDSNTTNDNWTKTWWGCPWNENWYYSALFLDPNVTTSSTPGVVPAADYIIPHLRSGKTITVDGNLSEWEKDNTLSVHVKYGDESTFENIKGTGDWASGYQQYDWNSFPVVVDGPEFKMDVTYDDSNLYVSAKVEDLIVTAPDNGGRGESVTFVMTPRKYVNGTGIFPSKYLTVMVDPSGNAKAKDDLIILADTAGVEYALQLGNGTNINNTTDPDSGYQIELKIPFSAFNYPVGLGDSVVFIGAIVNDLDVFDDINQNYFAKTWWFVQQSGQHGPAWVALGPANPLVGVDEEITVPLTIELLGNYPNPFNPSTKIKYSLNKVSDVTLNVFNILGQTVNVVNKSNVQAGLNEFNFDASGLASGVYLYQLKIKNISSNQLIDSEVSKMILIK